jgi:alpha/beta superfamily hydrolase
MYSSSLLTTNSTNSGAAEAEDFRELVDNVVLPLFSSSRSTLPSASSNQPTTPSPRTVELLLCGYSFGALAASSCLPPTSISNLHIQTSYLLISYPLSVMWALSFFQSRRYTEALHTLVKHGGNRVLAVFGDNDQFSAIAKLRGWAMGLEEVAGEEGRWSAVEVSGADHFWRDQSTKAALLDEVRRWLAGAEDATGSNAPS